MMSKELNKSILDGISASRWGYPEDFKGSAISLSSVASDYVHGEILTVDGGYRALTYIED
jgi:2-deoxy-D-gluconate 3-dehydrogenase